MFKLLRKTVDLYLSFAVIVFTLCMMTQLESMSGETLYMPRAILIFMLFTAVWIALRAVIVTLRGKNQEFALDFWNILFGILLPGCAVLLLSLALRKLGFYLTSAIIIFVINIIQDFVTRGKVEISPKKLFQWAFTSIAVCAALYLFFHVLIQLRTPVGILGI